MFLCVGLCSLFVVCCLVCDVLSLVRCVFFVVFLFVWMSVVVLVFWLAILVCSLLQVRCWCSFFVCRDVVVLRWALLLGFIACCLMDVA